MQITIIRICVDLLSGGAIIHPTGKNHYQRKTALLPACKAFQKKSWFRRKAALFFNNDTANERHRKKTANRNHDPAGKLQPEPSRLSTDRLFNGARELIIEHAGEAYRLRITSKGKLILTK